MKKILLLLSTSCWIFLFAWPNHTVLSTFAGGITREQFDVPNGMYAHEDFPPCRQGVDTGELAGKALVSGGLETVFASNPYGWIAVGIGGLVVGARSGILQGDIGRLIVNSTGGSWSACDTKCVFIPRDQRVTLIKLTGRDGKEVCKEIPYSSGGLHLEKVKHCGPWAGWEKVSLRENENGTVVCATAANWSHNNRSNPVIEVHYEPR